MTDRERGTLEDVTHTHPYTDEAFGETQVFERGHTVVADGGRDADRESEAEESVDDGERLQDVDHTPPRNATSANGVHERGSEGRDDDTEDDRV